MKRSVYDIWPWIILKGQIKVIQLVSGFSSQIERDSDHIQLSWGYGFWLIFKYIPTSHHFTFCRDFCIDNCVTYWSDMTSLGLGEWFWWMLEWTWPVIKSRSLLWNIACTYLLYLCQANIFYYYSDATMFNMIASGFDSFLFFKLLKHILKHILKHKMLAHQLWKYCKQILCLCVFVTHHPQLIFYL